MTRTRPLLIVSGFLGSGKTTLLRQMLAGFAKSGLTADVILNDIANADIDAATLDTSSAKTVSPIAAGCACCESLDELVSICQTAARGTGDILMLELNGTADPLALLEAFTLIEKRLPFFPRLQVCVVDARHWGAREEFSNLEMRQLESAGFWLLTHTDQVSQSHSTQLRNTLRVAAPNSKETSAARMVETLAKETLRAVGTIHQASQSHRPTAGPESDISSHATSKSILLNDTAHQLSHRFTGYELRLPLKVRTIAITRLLGSLPTWVLRAKALVKLREQPGCRWLFEKVGNEIAPEPMPVHSIRRSPSSLVCVGPRLDAPLLEKLVESEFGNSWKTE